MTKQAFSSGGSLAAVLKSVARRISFFSSLDRHFRIRHYLLH